VSSWILRPIVWFATASIATTVFHELVHAIAAYALGVRSTLHNYSVELHPTPTQAAGNIPAIVGVSGPSACLVLGIVAWAFFKRARGSAAELPLLFFTVFGIGTFFGNLMSASFVGDFSRAAIAWQLPMSARHSLTVAGAAGAAAIHFWAGRALMRWAPSEMGRMAGMLGLIVAPVIFGTAVVLLANAPSVSVSGRSAEAGSWVFAAIGALTANAHSGGEPVKPRWMDGAAALFAILIVRLLMRGVPFVP
jgi:hypothetical protein